MTSAHQVRRREELADRASVGAHSPPDFPDGQADAVEIQLELLHERINCAVATWIGRVREESISRTERLLMEAASSLEEIVESMDKGGVGSEHVRSYCRELRLKVLEPLKERLEEARLGETLIGGLDQLLADLSSAASQLDEEVVRPEPEKLYDPHASDGWNTSVRKSWVRGGRRRRRITLAISNGLRRLVGRPIREPKHFVQRVPLRQLACYHVQVRLPEELRADYEVICQTVATTMAVVERTMTEHVHVMLEAQSGDLTDVRGQAARFRDRLHEASTEIDLDLDRVEEKIDKLMDRLRMEVFESGSFMLEMSRRETGRGEEISHRTGARAAQWIAWNSRVVTRIQLMQLLVVISERKNALEQRLVEQVISVGVQPIMEALHEARDRLYELAEMASKDFQTKASAEQARRYLEQALQAVEQGMLEILHQGRHVQKTRDASDEAAIGLAGVVQAVPERLELNVLSPQAGVDPDHAPKWIELREHAVRAFDALVVEKLRRETDRIASAISSARHEAEGVPTILRFNLEAAVDDLERASDADAQTTARELVVDGLVRSADLLGRVSSTLGGALEPFTSNVRDVFERGFATLHERVRVEEPMLEQMLDFRSGAEAELRRIMNVASERARITAILGRRALRAGLARSRHWVRAGRAVAGLGTTTEQERLATLEALNDTERVLDGLPLVYRRLFAFQPIQDPSLLEGRDTDLRAFENYVDRWKRGLADALVLTGFHGCGQTSFLNVLLATTLRDADVAHVDVRKWLRTEDELVEALSPDGTSTHTLDALADELCSGDAGQQLRVYIVEHLEHLYRRQVGGTGLIRAFLALTSRTNSHIIWILTVSDVGWQIIRRAEPTASRLVTVHALSEITRDELESIILNRHRRSGLPLRFEPPSSNANPLLGRRLRKTRTEEARQALLREEYFDRLQRLSGQNIMMALLYWLRSIEMAEERRTLLVNSVDPLNFSFLQPLDLEQAFTLKAVLEHASLTVEEHADIFLIPLARSLEIFESLASLILIEPMEKQGVQSRFASSPVQRGVRYRIRPMLIHAVFQYLREKNILH